MDLVQAPYVAVLQDRDAYCCKIQRASSKTILRLIMSTTLLVAALRLVTQQLQKLVAAAFPHQLLTDFGRKTQV